MSARASLSAPASGWSTLSVDGHEYAISYLTDIPVEWPRQLAQALKDNRPVTLYADLEGEELYLVLYHGFAAAVLDEDDVTSVRLDTNLTDFARDMLESFQADLDAWSRWNPDMELTDDAGRARQKTSVRIGLQDLESALSDA